MGRLESIKEQLELTTLGDLPYRESDDEKIAMLHEQDAILATIAAETYRLRALISKERESYGTFRAK